MPLPGPREDLWLLILTPKLIEFVLLVFALMLVVDAIILPAFCCIANSIVDAFNYCRLNST